MTNYEKIKQTISMEEIAETRVYFDNVNVKWTGQDIDDLFVNREDAVQAEILFLQDEAPTEQAIFLNTLYSEITNVLNDFKNQQNCNALYSMGCKIQRCWEEYFRSSSLYEYLCNALTDYENPDEAKQKYNTDSYDVTMFIRDGLYTALENIKNNWNIVKKEK